MNAHCAPLLVDFKVSIVMKFHLIILVKRNDSQYADHGVQSEIITINYVLSLTVTELCVAL